MINNVALNIWDRQFSLAVEYNCHKDEVPTKRQERILKRFISHPEWIEKSKKAIELYCRDDVEKDVKNEKKDNIFSYIKPDYILIKRTDNQPYVALMCKYKYDIEHGIAVAFSSNGKATITIQDEIL